jgi:predicted lipoprotein with Yx(FWY)xxD motif
MIPSTFTDRSRFVALFAIAVLAVGACTGSGPGAATTGSAGPTASDVAAGGLASSSASEAPSSATSAAPSTAPAAGGGGYGRGGASGEPTPSPKSTPKPTARPVTGSTIVVRAGMASGYPVLTGKGGMTLYENANDSASRSSCTGSCASAWPPLVIGAHDVVKGGSGVSGTFRTILRSNGSRQVTYRGHPLYYFSGDGSAGDMNGDGVSGIWSAAAP